MIRLLGDVENPISRHRYLYAELDPVNVIDPSGMFGIASMSVGMSVHNSLQQINSDVQTGILQDVSDTFGGADFFTLGIVDSVLDSWGVEVPDVDFDFDIPMDDMGLDSVLATSAGDPFRGFPYPIIIDQNTVEKGMVRWLITIYGDNVIAMGTTEEVIDEEIIEVARRSNAVIVTNNDKDFKGYRKTTAIGEKKGSVTEAAPCGIPIRSRIFFVF